MKQNRVPVLLRMAAPLFLLAGLAGCGSTGGGASGARASAGAGAAAVKLTAVEQTLMHDIAQANIAEVQTGKLALSKSQDPQVRMFAQKMIDDHTTAMQELERLAQTKGVTLPKNTDLMHRALAMELDTLSGADFDRQYMSQVGVNDHKRTQELLEATAQHATDPDLKAYARKTLTVVSGHLNAATQSSGK